MSDSDWAIVETTHDPREAEQLASLLRERSVESKQLQVTTPGRRGGATTIVYELYVPAASRDAARRALAELVREPIGKVSDARSSPSGRCPVHDAPLDVPCVRCGTFICASCIGDGGEAICDPCDTRLFEARKQVIERRGAKYGRIAVWFLLAALGVLLVLRVAC